MRERTEQAKALFGRHQMMIARGSPPLGLLGIETEEMETLHEQCSRFIVSFDQDSANQYTMPFSCVAPRDVPLKCLFLSQSCAS